MGWDVSIVTPILSFVSFKSLGVILPYRVRRCSMISLVLTPGNVWTYSVSPPSNRVTHTLWLDILVPIKYFDSYSIPLDVVHVHLSFVSSPQLFLYRKWPRSGMGWPVAYTLLPTALGITLDSWWGQYGHGHLRPIMWVGWLHYCR